MNDCSPRYAIYFVPGAETEFYRYGSSVLGYDCYAGDAIPFLDELKGWPGSWREITEEPRRYGFHATLKAPFHLSPNCSESQLIDALEHFTNAHQGMPTFSPAVRMISGFAAIVPQQPEAEIKALATDCTITFDSFRAPMPSQERARRLAAGLTAEQIENLDRWGYPYLFADFRFHLTLTGKLGAPHQKMTIAALAQYFERLCGAQRVPIDRLALLKQDAPLTPFRVVRSSRLRAFR
jgi:Protein of unknown function (DUF1045)